jgi:hypothetical protein
LRDLGRDEFRSTGAEDFAVEIYKLHDHIKGQLHNNSQRYKRKIDQRRREINFEVGDKVLAHLRKYLRKGNIIS